MFLVRHTCCCRCFSASLCVHVSGQWILKGEQQRETLELISKVSSLHDSISLRSFLGARILFQFFISVFRVALGMHACTDSSEKAYLETTLPVKVKKCSQHYIQYRMNLFPANFQLIPCRISYAELTSFSSK